MRTLVPASLLALCCGSTAWASDALEPPVKLEAGGQPIDVDIGHAAPFVVDWDGDGTADLLVGQFGEGKLRIHRGTAGGAKSAPALAAPHWFQAGGEDASIPSG